MPFTVQRLLKWQKERKLCAADIVEPRASGLTIDTLKSLAITQSDAKLKTERWLWWVL